MKRDRLFWLYIGVAVLIIIFLGFREVVAAPAAPMTYTATQPDGTTFKARVVGDEWNNRTVTLDGYTIRRDNASGHWVYMQKDAQGTLSKSSLKVGINAPAGITKGLKPVSNSIRGITPSRLAPGKAGTPSLLPPVTTAGVQPLLVILVKFADEIIHTTEAEWNASMFGASSSVKDYYDEVSYGALNLVPASESYSGGNDNSGVNDGIVVVVLPYNHPNTKDDISDVNRQVSYDALVYANPYVDFSSFDLDSNGYIATNELHIITVIGGYEAAYAGDFSCEPNIWGHHWAFGGGFAAPSLDGVVVADGNAYGGYSQIGEMHGYDDPNVGGDCLLAHKATIGIVIHELGHNLWWPDMYDVDEPEDVAGIGDWGIMASGCWNSSGGYAGNSPSHPTPWEKWYSEWITPIQITALTPAVSIPRVEDNPTVYQLGDNANGVDWSFYGSSGTGEYFLVENRQLTGYDVGLPTCGILIWHIDEGVAADNTCNMYQWGQRLVALEQQDGEFDLERYYDDDGGVPGEGGNNGDAGDPYLSGNEFNAITTPNSNYYTGGVSGVSVFVNDMCGATMSVDLDACALKTYYRDADGDTYGDDNNITQVCADTPPVGYVVDNTDCDDSDSGVNPGVSEALGNPGYCDGVDNNCDGNIDEDAPLSTFYRDGDADGYGDAAIFRQACAAPVGYVADNTDCDDTNPGVNPGESEICDGLDNDCSGQTDESLPSSTFYRDADGDGFGDIANSTQACSITILSGYVSDNTDCDDTNPGVKPGAIETCDGLDNNCDTVVDEGLLDTDADGLCDVIDPDDDGDGMSDTWELSNGLDSLDPSDATADPDGDGFNNLQEYERDWDPQHAAQTIYVDIKNASGNEFGTDEYPYVDIQKAIDEAYSGDTILVDTGTYYENINFNGKTLMILGEGGGEGTVISGSWLGAYAYLPGPVVTFENGEGPYTELNGFVLMYGGNYLGGGIEVSNGSSPRIVNNIIINNGGIYGGGIGCNDSSPTIINNTIAYNGSTALGGGIYCIGNSSPIVTNTILWYNEDGIYLDGGASITVTYSNVEGSDVGASNIYGATNIDANPLFVNASSGHLQAGSPCIDAGTGNGAPSDDIDDDSRPQGSGYDIGADEYAGNVCTDSDGDGYSLEGGGCGAIDCDDTDASANPGADETCDGVDNDCNGEIDEGCAGGASSASASSAGTSAGGAGAGGGGGGCFIATAAFGTPMAEQVRILCEFRDRYLLTNTWGQRFVELYYNYSPPVADYITDKDGLKLVVRICLIPLLIVALFMLKAGMVTKLLLIGGLMSLLMAWMVRVNKRKRALSLLLDR